MYCDVIVEQLLLPIAEAALSLGELPQLSYMSLSASILLNEYRKAITINHHTYRYVHTHGEWCVQFKSVL